MVFRRSGKEGLSQQNRLLVPMSVFDIIGSVALAFSTTPIPKGSNCTYGALGNQGTCVAQGIMYSIGLTVPWYNAILCIYYMSVIKYNVKDNVLAKYEPIMHFVAISVPLIVTVIAASNNLYNNFSLLCFISLPDRYFVEKNEDQPVALYLSLYVIVFASGVIVLITIAYCMTQIYTFVKETETKMNKYSFRKNSFTSNTNRSKSQSRSNLKSTVEDTKKQALLYVCSFILTYIFTLVMLLFELVFKIQAPFPIMLMQGIFSPLQGFWNFLAYIRPRFVIVSDQHDDKNIFQRLFITIFKKPETTRPRQRGTRRSIPSSLSNNRKVQMKKNRIEESKENEYVQNPSFPVEIKDNDIPRRNNDDNTRLSPLMYTSSHDDEEGIEHKPTKNTSYASGDGEIFDMSKDIEKNSPQRSKNNYENEQTDDTDDEPVAEDFMGRYCNIASLSLLVAEDVLPPSVRRELKNSGREKRRVSMIDRFPSHLKEVLKAYDYDDDDNSNENELGLFGANCGVSNDNNHVDLSSAPSKKTNVRQKRRHSCPVIYDIGNIDKNDFEEQ